MPRKPRADSTQGAVKAMLDAAKGIPAVPPHVTLRPGDEPFWQGIVRARGKDDWSDSDLVVAAQLARTQADIEREQAEWDREGTIVTNARGTQVANPRVSVLEALARREMALMRTLRLAGAAGGDLRSQVAQQRARRDAEAAREAVEAEEDDLLAS